VLINNYFIFLTLLLPQDLFKEAKISNILHCCAICLQGEEQNDETLQLYLYLQLFVWFCILVPASFVTSRISNCNISSIKHTTKYSVSINKYVVLVLGYPVGLIKNLALASHSADLGRPTRTD
jgi:hypothetical protein